MSPRSQSKGRRSRDSRILTLKQALDIAAQSRSKKTSYQADKGKAVFAILERIETRFSNPSNFGRLTCGERLFWDVAHMESEVLNGGFSQYFTNSTGQAAEAVKRHLRLLGSKETLGIFRRASKISPRGSVPTDDQRRADLVSKFEQQNGPERLDNLSEAYYRKSEDLESLLLTYVQEHKAEFSEPSDELVRKLKWKTAIGEHFCGPCDSQFVSKAAEALDVLEDFAESDPTADWKEEAKKDLAALARKGKKTEVISIYSRMFMCSMAKAKLEIEKMLKSS